MCSNVCGLAIRIYYGVVFLQGYAPLELYHKTVSIHVNKCICLVSHVDIFLLYDEKNVKI
jgi:hypothetical protein